MPIGYDMVKCSISDVEHLFAAHHGYKTVGRVAVAAFAVMERGEPVAAYLWQPPAPGAAVAVCPSAPWSVLALSRMVAVPRDQRDLNHVSRPLRRQMKHEIDRGRWPVLITYSDSSLGHTGHVYQCSGWQRDGARGARIFVDETGGRRSPYANGAWAPSGLTCAGSSTITRWTHRACEVGGEEEWMALHGWVRRPIQGKVWRSGRQAYEIINTRSQS